MSPDDGDLGEMLEELANADYSPVVHPTADGTGWVAYAQAPGRESYIGAGPDPESAVRCLYIHTFGRSTVPSPAAERPAVPSVVQASREPGMIPRPQYGVQLAIRPSAALCEALHAMAERARLRALDVSSHRRPGRG